MSFAIERRRAGRLACRLPVRLMRGGHMVYAETQDLSRSGVRLRVSISALGLAPSSGLADVARHLGQRLGEAFVAEFAWPTLGSLVRRVLRVVRVAHVTGNADAVDLGCELRVALETQETDALGVTLPPIADAAALAESEAGLRAIFLARAVLMPPRARGAAPLRVQAREIRPEGLVVTVPHPSRAGLAQPGQDVTGLLLAFDARFGREPHVLIMGSEEPLWSGAARLDAVEWQRAEDLLHVSLALDEPLRPDERERLGLD